jgi:hypothetical protein
MGQCAQRRWVYILEQRQLLSLSLIPAALDGLQVTISWYTRQQELSKHSASCSAGAQDPCCCSCWHLPAAT